MTKGNQDVATALGLLTDSLKEERNRIYNVGSAAMLKQDPRTAKAVISFVSLLDKFNKKAVALGKNWKRLLRFRDAATPEVREVMGRRLFVPPETLKEQRTRKAVSGYTRKVGKVGPKTNFTVTFPDGKTIAAKKASDVLVKTIAEIGPERVAALNLVVGGEPLVARKVSTKYPSSSHGIPGGFHVLTHSSTKKKMELVLRMAARLGLALKIDGTAASATVQTP